MNERVTRKAFRNASKIQNTVIKLKQMHFRLQHIAEAVLGSDLRSNLSALGVFFAFAANSPLRFLAKSANLLFKRRLVGVDFLAEFGLLLVLLLLLVSTRAVSSTAESTSSESDEDEFDDEVVVI